MSASASPGSMDFTNGLVIADPYQGVDRANRGAAISFNGNPAVWRLPAMQVQFEPSAYGPEADANRTTVSFKAPESLSDELWNFDCWVLDYWTRDSERLFGRKMTRDALNDLYVSPVKSH